MCNAVQMLKRWFGWRSSKYGHFSEPWRLKYAILRVRMPLYLWFCASENRSLVIIYVWSEYLGMSG